MLGGTRPRAGALGAEHRVRAWFDERDAIRREILERGWSDSAGAFTQSFGAEALDASGLLIPIVGCLPADDRRVRATVAATADGLTDHRGLVFRYRAANGLEGGEGTFLLCTFWLAHARWPGSSPRRRRRSPARRRSRTTSG